MKIQERIGAVLFRAMCVAGLAGMASCAIENDIPYPLVEGSISEIVVEGLRASEDGTVASGVDIDKTVRTVTLYVNDSVDVSELKITRLILDPRDARLELDSARCADADKFPFHDFASLDSLPLSANTRLDLSSPLQLNVKTYYDNLWKLTVHQIVDRKVEVDGMTRYVLDPDSRVLVIYVSEDQDLSDIQIRKLNLGGAYGRVTPDPTTVHDFTFSQTFYAARRGQDVWQEWKVVVSPEDGSGTSDSNVFPMVTKAFLSGSVTSGKTPVVEFQEQGAADWTAVSDVSTSGASFTATLSGLRGSTTYSYRVSVDGSIVSDGSFSTVAEVPLTNGSFEDWSEEGKVMNPWASGGTPFWGTGNPGAAGFIGNLTTSTDESVSGKAAKLETKDAVIKLGAGNIFTGDFALDGTNGILTVGRSFNSFPTALRFHYKYTSATINKIGQDVGDLANLNGRPDSCHIYIALSDKSYKLKTKPTERKLFDPSDAGIIAYGQFTSGQSTTSYQQLTIPLEYRSENRVPKYIIIVATASKYGDYFIGGVGSTLWLDEMELVYE
ncbi:PCMD domain-containing protein [Parabacteroides sp.]|uniref:PCMD domain-containing protein n=1 Tax=Parabacteroides sp. TaxID=1869337 RepID=UPI00257B4B50|nr:PCMD domain-containing protein [Parabacteroides sp.]